MIIDRSSEFFSLIENFSPKASLARLGSPVSAKSNHSSSSSQSREVQSIFHALTQLRLHLIASFQSYIFIDVHEDMTRSSDEMKSILLTLRGRLERLQEDLQSMQLSSTVYSFSFSSSSYSPSDAGVHQLKGELECLEYKYASVSQLWMSLNLIRKERVYYFQLFRLQKKNHRKQVQERKVSSPYTSPNLEKHAKSRSLAAKKETMNERKEGKNVEKDAKEDLAKFPISPISYMSTDTDADTGHDDEKVNSTLPASSLRSSPRPPPSAWSQIDPVLLQTLEQEQVQLFASQASQLTTDIQNASQSLFGISELQQILSNHLSSQAVLVDQLYEEAIEAESMVNRAYEELKKAMMTPESSYRLATIILMILSMSLLFLDWYD